MRLIRLGQQHGGVAADVRAALTSIGRGATVVGGVAVTGVPSDDGPPVDAIVLMPHAVLVIVDVTLPAPVVNLDAPLHGQWTADGWPLSTAGGEVNPAVGALESARRLTTRLRGMHPAGEQARIGTIIAVGPYVETVSQPASELAGTVRVLYPTATSMLAATVSLPRSTEALNTTGVTEFLSALAPDAARPSDAALIAEGFAAPAPLPPEQEPTERYLDVVEPTVRVEPPPRSSSATRPREARPADATPGSRPVAPQQDPSSPAVAPTVTAQQPVTQPAASGASTPRQGKSAAVRWLPVGALTLLGILLVAAIVTAATSGAADTTAAPATATSTTKPTTTAAGIGFVARASATTTECASHAFGDLKDDLAGAGCLRLRRASFTAKVNGRTTATTVAVLGFPDKDTAADFKTLADTPGTGGIRDLAAQRGKWPRQHRRFTGAAYNSSIDGATVRLVRTDWIAAESAPGDPALRRTARAALLLPLPG